MLWRFGIYPVQVAGKAWEGRAVADKLVLDKLVLDKLELDKLELSTGMLVDSLAFVVAATVVSEVDNGREQGAEVAGH